VRFYTIDRGSAQLSPMKVLQLHNFYQLPGGEDQSFAAEVALLRDRGHEVVTYTMHNDTMRDMSGPTVALKTLWNADAYRAIRAIIKDHRPAVAHFQNTFPLISPAGYYAARSEGVPVIQSLRNFRLMCANALFFRNGAPCEDCLNKRVPWPAVAHACYRGSVSASAVAATMLTTHRTLGTWTKTVDVFVAMSEFGRKKFIEGGLSAERIRVKQNFLSGDPGAGNGNGEYALFVGRLSPEKGVTTLLAGWDLLRLNGLPLKIVGDGPLAPAVAQAIAHLDSITWLGNQPSERVHELMRGATLLVFPSECYEGSPRVPIESFACATPVMASNIGAIGEMVEHGRNGWHFKAGDAQDLAAQVTAATANRGELARMRREARREFETKYTATRNYEMIMDIYRRAIDTARRHGARAEGLE
jgi:glycosyltransferase involved in cell wall biosynthesis